MGMPTRSKADPTPRDALDDDAVRAFTLGFLDGLRDREVTPRDNPTSRHAEDVADHG